ncbi:TMEM175 family protein [Amycolatopsis sp. cmx-4-54]|uniref:TMEM175 family protein n=1 Tax=Amycolatopsis sp. cmx-4-54 TaxID=2790936 RepID=UPI00397B97EE
MIAIAFTLLALDLPIPHGDTTGAILSSISAHGKEYIAFALSFVVIAAHWRAHHEIFPYVRRLGVHRSRQGDGRRRTRRTGRAKGPFCGLRTSTPAPPGNSASAQATRWTPPLRWSHSSDVSPKCSSAA